MEQNNADNHRPSVRASALLILGAAGFMATFLAVCHRIGVTMPLFGLIFFVYWAAIMRQERTAYLPSVLGGMTGIGVAWLVIGLLPRFGTLGAACGFGAIGLMLFCFMQGRFKSAINNATMLYLTIATIQELGIEKNVLGMLASLLLGAGYVGLTNVIAKKIRSDRRGLLAG